MDKAHSMKRKMEPPTETEIKEIVGLTQPSMKKNALIPLCIKKRKIHVLTSCCKGVYSRLTCKVKHSSFSNKLPLKE